MTQKVRIPYIMGDGTGQDIWNASRELLEEAVIKAYNHEKEIEWIFLLAGEQALAKKGVLIPPETLETIKELKFAIKGPLSTPIGGGFRSINVYLRQVFDLYVCIRPIKYIKGLPSPIRNPDRIDMIIFRENTEDVYKGIEWEAESEEVKKLIDFLKHEMDVSLPYDSGIGIKPISKKRTERFVKWVLNYAVEHGRRKITIVHKGNIMKYTEGAFRAWAYSVLSEFLERFPEKKIAVNDVIADNMFMQVILRPEEYDVILCPNLNGDYLSDCCAALVGGLGVAPGANIGDDMAIFEPTHGSAPKYAGMDVVNPLSFILSACMLFDYIGLSKAKELIENAIERTLNERIMTYDLARHVDGVKPVRCSEFGKALLARLL
ncbi:MAG: NADP-dependent isocitrate dehydrogenase [Desulfobacterota bacterium]|nr:NADP-dependent isocitrate dehydrogenase [Thermodesulfobacteriota bacterium]MDW8001065.1 NADP-dependent isocitrate dehydrogenase [Deltaproteobacteria bacterium]